MSRISIPLSLNTYQTWAQLEQQAARQEQWEYELAEQERRSSNAEQQNTQTQTSTYQPDHWAMLARHKKLGQQTKSQESNQ